jgi:hypothetical protein
VVAEPGQLFRRPGRRQPSTAINTSGSISPAYHQVGTPTAVRYIVLRPADDDQDVIIREASTTRTRAKRAPQFQALSWLDGRDRQKKKRKGRIIRTQRYENNSLRRTLVARHIRQREDDVQQKGEVGLLLSRDFGSRESSMPFRGQLDA